MHHKIIEAYRRELPFVTVPLLILLGSICAVRFVAIPQFVHLNERTEQLNALPALSKEKSKLMDQLRVAASQMEPLPVYQTISISDESALIQQLIGSARKSGVTLTQTSPSRDDAGIIVQTAFTTTWEGMIRFLKELEKYPLQLTTMPLALKRDGSLIEVTLTVKTVPSGGAK